MTQKPLSSYPDSSVFLFTCSCGFEKEAGKKQLVSVYGILNDIESVSRHTARFIGGCDRDDCCVTCEVFEDDEAVAGMAGAGRQRRERMSETDYIEGQRSAWRRILQECLTHLGYKNERLAALAHEREQAVATLRIVCKSHGDNDWPDDLHLSDIIDKHLARHIDQ